MTTIEPNALSSLRIPVGDAVGRPGFDGQVVTSAGNAFVPIGMSIWEMGTGEPGPKAEEDYQSRCKNPRGIDPSKTVFVFVGCHRWDGRDNWVKEKRAEGKWLDVRALDNVDLETWLEAAPAVARWLAVQMDVPASGLLNLDLAWGEFQAKYGLAIVPDLVIGGRTKPLTAVHEWITGGNTELCIEGESVEEAEAFFSAAVLKLPDDQRNSVASRLVYVDHPDVLDSLMAVEVAHFVVARNPEVRQRAAALKSSRIRLVSPIVKSAGTSARKAVWLGAANRTAVSETLRAMGLTEQKAGRIAMESKGSLGAVLLMAAPVHDVLPPWTSGSGAADLLSLMLAGQWEMGNERDKAAVEKLAARPYAEIDRVLHIWSTPTGPIIRRDTIWDWLGWDFAWAHLSPQLTQVELNRFRAVLNDVFGIPDPRFDLPPAERWAAPMYGKAHPYSASLRAGLVSSLAQIAIHSDNVLNGVGQGFVDAAVRQRLVAEGKPNLPAWLALEKWLPDIAEASPDVFLQSLELLAGDPECVSAIFSDEGFFGCSPHVYLLWALERLAWSKDYLSRVALVLGRLAAIDPGGQLRNRPANTLVDIFLPWKPGTAASASHRLDVLDVLHQRFADVAWKLAVELLPDQRPHGSTDAPKWRRWKPEKPAKVTGREYWSFLEELIKRMLEWAGTSGKRWASLVKVCDTVHGHPARRNQISDKLRSLNLSDISSSELAELRDEIRRFLVRHRRFADEDGAMTEEELRLFDEFYDRTAPDDLVDECLWLFGHSPELPREKGDDYEKHMQKVMEEREKVLRKIYTSMGMAGLLKLIGAAAAPESAGRSIGFLDLCPEDEAKLLMLALSAKPGPSGLSPEFQAGIGYISTRYQKSGPDWIQKASSLPGVSWTAQMHANFAWGLPTEGSTWDCIAGWGSEIGDLYWSQVPIGYIRNPANDLERAVRNLANARRPYRAIDLMGYNLPASKDKPPFPLPLDLVIQVLDQAAERDPRDEVYPPGMDMLASHLAELLGWAEEQGASVEKLAGWEWVWLPLLKRGERYGRRGLRTLQRALSTTPSLFVDVLKIVYRGDSEDRQALTEEECARATQAGHLLREWVLVPGMTNPDPKVEVDRDDGDIFFSSGQIDPDRFRSWVDESRRLAHEAGRLDVCDSEIGQLLAYAPTDAQGVWPCEPVRQLLEDLASESLEDGLDVGIFNRRGAMWRAAGGSQERKLAEKFRSYAEKTTSKWPRTSALLRRIVNQLELQARREDAREAFDEFE